MTTSEGKSSPIIDYGRPSKGQPGRFRRIAVRVIIILGAVIACIAGVVGIAVLRIDSRLQRARTHIPIVRARLNSDLRFQKIEMSEFTKLNGSLLVDGSVLCQKDLDDLQQIVGSTSPPVPVCWNVTILSAEQIDRAVRLNLLNADQIDHAKQLGLVKRSSTLPTTSPRP